MKKNNIFKSAYTYIIVAIIAYVFNTYILRVGVTSNFLYLKSGLSIIGLILAIVTPILALIIYSKEDRIKREKTIIRKGITRYYLSKFLQLFFFVIFTFLVSLLGILLYNHRLYYGIEISKMIYLGIVIIAGIYSATIIFVYEFLLNILKEKSISVSPIVSIIMLLIPIQISSNIIGMITSLVFSNIYIDTFIANAVFITTIIAEIIYFALLVFLGICSIKICKNIYLNNYISKISDKKKEKNNNNNENEAKKMDVSKIVFTKKRQIISYILLCIIYILAAAIFVRVAIHYDDYYLGMIDMTESNIYKLSDELKEELKNVKDDIDLIYYGEDYKEVFDLKAKEIENITDKIHYINMPPNNNYNNSSSSSSSSSNNKDVLGNEKIYIKKKENEKTRIYSFTADMDSMIPVSEKGNEIINVIDGYITEGLKAVSLEEKDATIGYIKINEETKDKNGKVIDEFKEFKDSLNMKGRIVRDIRLTNISDLDNVKGVIIAEQNRDLTNEEYDILDKFIKRGGNIAIFRAPKDKEGNEQIVQENFEKLTKQFGLNIPIDKVVFDLGEDQRLQLITAEKEKDEENKDQIENDEENTKVQASKITYDNAVIYPVTNKENPFNQIIELRKSYISPVLLFNGLVEVSEDEEKQKLNVTTQNIFETSDSGLLLDEYTPEDMTKESLDKGKKGKYSLAEISTKQIDENTKSKMLAFSSKYMFSSYPYYNLTKTYSPIVKLQQTQEIIRSIANFLTFDEDTEMETKKEVLEAFYLNDKTESTQKAYDDISKKITMYSLLVFFLGILFTILKNLGYIDISMVKKYNETKETKENNMKKEKEEKEKRKEKGKAKGKTKEKQKDSSK